MSLLMNILDTMWPRRLPSLRRRRRFAFTRGRTTKWLELPPRLHRRRQRCRNARRSARSTEVDPHYCSEQRRWHRDWRRSVSGSSSGSGRSNDFAHRDLAHKLRESPRLQKGCASLWRCEVRRVFEQQQCTNRIQGIYFFFSLDPMTKYYTICNANN